MDKVFLRFVSSLLMLVLSTVFGWWFLIISMIIYPILVRNPIEIFFWGAVGDVLFYTGDGFVFNYTFSILSLVVFFLVNLLSDRVEWRKIL